MSPTSERPGLGIEIPFLLLSTLTWLICLLIFQANNNILPNQIANIAAFITFAIAISYFALLFVGYFGVIRLFPRRSDLLLVIIAMPCGGMTSWFFNSTVMNIYDSILLNSAFASPFIAFFTFGFHHLFTSLRIRVRGTQKIVLDLTPQERALVIQDLAGWGFLERLNLLSRRDLETELMGPNPRSISLVIISPSTASSFENDETILEAHLAGIPIVDYRRICARLSGRIRLGHSSVWEYVMAATPQTKLIRFYAGLKTVLEPILATTLAIVLLPLMALIAIFIRLSGPGCILFKQTRVGYKQQQFELIKFRTMKTDSECSTGACWCQENDSRITKFGKFLRQTRLDELPQLWNVICGEMSFIGPRPEQPELAHTLKENIPAFALRTLVKPGISGWAQVCSGYAASIEESRLKLEYDLFYIQNMSPRIDLIVVLRTLATVILGDRKHDKTVLVELQVDIPKTRLSMLLPGNSLSRAIVH